MFLLGLVVPASACRVVSWDQLTLPDGTRGGHYDVTGSLTSLGGNVGRLIDLRISMVGSIGLRAILYSYLGSLVSSLLEKAPFALLFSIRIYFYLVYIGNGFFESLCLPK